MGPVTVGVTLGLCAWCPLVGLPVPETMDKKDCVAEQSLETNRGMRRYLRGISVLILCKDVSEIGDVSCKERMFSRNRLQFVYL